MEMTEDYINDTAKAHDANIGDVASIIALAILEADGDYAKAIQALENATNALRARPIGQQAAQCFSQAIYHIGVFDEASDLEGRRRE